MPSLLKANFVSCNFDFYPSVSGRVKEWCCGQTWTKEPLTLSFSRHINSVHNVHLKSSLFIITLLRNVSSPNSKWPFEYRQNTEKSYHHCHCVACSFSMHISVRQIKPSVCTVVKCIALIFPIKFKWIYLYFVQYFSGYVNTYKDQKVGSRSASFATEKPK